ncbi:hypothetical protein AAC387_Pa03g0544 [Persea americana]
MAAKSENEQSIAEVPRRRRKKSMVWEHFTVEAVAGGCARACCKRCKQTFAYSTGDNIKIIDEGIHELYLEYIAQPLPLTPAYEEQGATPNAVEGTLLCSNDGLLDFDVYISETASNQQTKSELDQYLEEAVLPRGTPAYCVFAFRSLSK